MDRGQALARMRGLRNALNPVDSRFKSDDDWNKYVSEVAAGLAKCLVGEAPTAPRVEPEADGTTDRMEPAAGKTTRSKKGKKKDDEKVQDAVEEVLTPVDTD